MMHVFIYRFDDLFDQCQEKPLKLACTVNVPKLNNPSRAAAEHVTNQPYRHEAFQLLPWWTEKVLFLVFCIVCIV